jgi:predicted dienelactone hydrolase
MRTLEISVLIVLAAALIGFFSGPTRRPAWLKILPWTALALMLAHFGMEGYRWQMAPAYLLVALGCLLTLKRAPHQETRDSRWRTAVRIAGGVLGLAVCGGTGFLAVTIPVFDDPAPSGPFRVGTTRLHLVDRSREDPLAPVAHTPRELLVVAWYPAEAAPGVEAEPFWPNAPAAAPVMARVFHLPRFNFLQHLRLVQSHSYPDAPVAQAQAQYPVLIFSHGYGLTPWQNTVQMEELASHGFVVFSIGHTYESVAIPFPDGRVVPVSPARVEALARKDPAEAKRIATESLGVWVADTRCVIDELTKINVGTAAGGAQSGNRFTNRLDLMRLGVFGMSFGGATAGEFCLQDARCKAGMNMDGSQQGNAAQHPLSVPFLYFVKEGNKDNDPIYARARGDLYRLEIRHSTHANFSDASLVLPILKHTGLLGSVDAKEMERILNAYIVAFFQKHLEGKQAPLLEGPPPAGQFPDVIFTARKAPRPGQ